LKEEKYKQAFSQYLASIEDLEQRLRVTQVLEWIAKTHMAVRLLDSNIDTPNRTGKK